MTSSILPLAKGSRARREWPTGSAQCAALVCVLLINALVADNFFAIHIQDGRLFGSLIDILNRCAAGPLSLGWMARAELRTALIKVRPMFDHSGPFGLYRPMSDHILRRAYCPSITTNSQFK